MNISCTIDLNVQHKKVMEDAFPQHHFTYYDSVQRILEDGICDAEVLLIKGQELSVTLVERSPQLKWIHVISAGVDCIPFELLEDRSIIVTNAKGVFSIPLAEYTLSAILHHTKRSHHLKLNQLQALWDRSLSMGEIYGKTIGIFGLGSIGSEIAKRAKAFGMNVLGVRRQNGNGERPPYIDDIIHYDNSDELFKKSDFVVLTIPLTEETKHAIGAAQLHIMKKTAVLINISRGGIVDEHALLQALQEKTIAGAYLDVFSIEPLPSDHPFWRCDNVLISPHISGRSPNNLQRGIDIFCDNLHKYNEQTELLNIVDLKKGY